MNANASGGVKENMDIQYGFTWDTGMNIYWFDSREERDMYAGYFTATFHVPIRKYVNRSGVKLVCVTQKSKFKYDYIVEE